MAVDDGLEITWYGQAMFTVAGGGVTVACDPTSPDTGYRYEPVAADVVLMSHDHFDHNYLAGVKGEPKVVRTQGSTALEGLEVAGYPTFHDSAGGSQRGSNIIFSWTQAGMRIAHLGDLGEPLDPGIEDSLRDLDIAMVPVGGVFTVDGAEAAALVERLAPGIAIPMHYGTPDCKIGLNPLEEFTGNVTVPVRRIEERPLRITREDVPASTEVWVIPYR